MDSGQSLILKLKHWASSLHEPFRHTGRRLTSFYSFSSLSFFQFFLENLRPLLSFGWGGGAEPASAIGQQGHGVPVFCSNISPLLSRNASCFGSRPRNFFSISEASSEPPGCRMNFL